MAEETDLSRTEPASPRRLQDARRAGDVPRSGELTRWAMLLAALGVLGWSGGRLLGGLQAMAAAAWGGAAEPLSPTVLTLLGELLWLVLPVLAAIFVAALVAPLLLSGWVFAPRASQPDFARASPLRALSRLFSHDAWFDAAAAVLRLGLVAGALAWALSTGWDVLPGTAADASLPAFAAWVGRGVLAVAVALALGVALDAGWRWWRYLRRHAMTWQEVLAEAREAELPAEVQAQLRARQQQVGQRAGTPSAPTALPRAGELPEGRQRAAAVPGTIDEVIG
jgi:flagellar biosynthetic protein FlhB